MTKVEENSTELSAPAGYRIAAFCKMAPMSRSTFFRLVKRGEIKTIRYGGLVVVPRAEAERLFQFGTGKAA